MRKYIICLLSVIFLFGCSSNHDNKIDSSFKYESDMNLEMKGVYGYQNIAPSSKGIYYSAGNYLYFYDYQTQKTVFLCNKPDCKHREEKDWLVGETCSAYMQNGYLGGLLEDGLMVYNDGYIYMYQHSFVPHAYDEGYDIVRILYDGSKREDVQHFTENEYVNEIVVHRGNLYVIYGEENDENNHKLMVKNLDKKTTSCPLDGIAQNVRNIVCKDNYLYFSADKLSYGSQDKFYVFAKMDLDNNTVEVLLENLTDMLLGFTFVDDARLTYFSNHDTYLLDLETMESKFLSDSVGQVTVGDKYVFIDNSYGEAIYSEGERIVEIYDKSFNLLATYRLDNRMSANSGVINDELYIKASEENDRGYCEKIVRISLDKNGKIIERVFSEVYPEENNFFGFYWVNNE